MKDDPWYNGYPWPERIAKFKELVRLRDCGELGRIKGPCALCGDPDPPFDPPFEDHDEDYSKPYLWGPPALFALCGNCHKDKLHKRFARPIESWKAFLAHVRRGGYARELKDPVIKREIAAFKAAMQRGETSSLRQLRPYAGLVGKEWFANLRMDIESLSDPTARPRP
jgi:hypothetical protein